jgi:hypothetical protein
MSDDDKRSLVARQEVLPPLRQTISSVPDVANLPPGLFGTSLFARARYASEQKQIEAYTRLVHAKNELVRELETQFHMAVSFARASERAGQMETHKAIGRSQAELEWGLLEEQRREAGNERRELDKLAFEEEKEVRLLRVEQAKRSREQFLAAPVPAGAPKAPPTTADKLKSVGQEIDEIERAFADERERMIRAAGGEENLSDDESRRLGQFEMMKNKILNDVMAELGE